MRVLIFHLTADFGGAERHTMELAGALSREHDVAMLLLKRPRAAEWQARYDTLIGAVPPGVRLFVTGKKFPLLGLLEVMWRFRPDIIHAHLPRSVRWARRLPLGPPIIATNHNGHFAEYDGCDGLICLTSTQVERLPPGRRGAVFQIGNWVLPRRAADRAAARRALGLSPGQFIIGSVGRLDPAKGFPALVDAFLAADLPSATLVIVGTGRDEPALRARAEASGGRVRLAGFRSDVRELYPAFDLFVLNSANEEFPLVLLEALDAGLPVIATATDGARAIAERSDIHLVGIGDQAGLIAALRAGRDGRIRPSPAGSMPFQIGAVVPSLVAAYGEVIARRRKSTSNATTIPSTTQT